MVDRTIVQATETPSVKDVLRAGRNGMIGLAKLSEALLGKSQVVRGLDCTPTTPASLDVTVGEGEIYSNQNVDDTAYGSLPADTAHQIVKQGIKLDSNDHPCPAPSTAGFSINYLIQAEFAEVDDLNETRPFYNAADPSEPFYNFVDSAREDRCVVTVKAGAEATSGTQLTPTPDSGNSGLWVITVDYGQIEIEVGDIVRYVDAPVIDEYRYLYYSVIDRDGSNNYTGNVVPGITAYRTGMVVVCKIVTANTSDATLALNGLAATPIKDLKGNVLAASDFLGFQTYILVYNDGIWIAQTISNSAFGEPVGLIKQGYFLNLPGFLLLEGGVTIGNAVSGATHASADYQSLFIHLYGVQDDSLCPVSGGRSGSTPTTALADFNAGKTMGLPQVSSRGIGGYGSGPELTPRGMGALVGVEEVALTEAQNGTHGHVINDPHHGHDVSDPTHDHGVSDPHHGHLYSRYGAPVSFKGEYSGNPIGFDIQATQSSATGIAIIGSSTGVTVSSGATGITVGNSGSGTAHENMPPMAFIPTFIKY